MNPTAAIVLLATMFSAMFVVILLHRTNAVREGFFEFANGSGVCNNVFFFEMENFLTAEQCDTFRAAAAARGMKASAVGEEESQFDTNVRNSTQTWFDPGDHDVATYIHNKVVKLIRSERFGSCFDDVDPDADFEDVQVVRYGVNGKYDPHYDGTPCGDDLNTKCFRNQRIATVLIYLNNDFHGGETRFPNLGVSVKPKKGKAVFFWVSEPSSRLVYNETLHGGDPVMAGEKWIATQWIRANNTD